MRPPSRDRARAASMRDRHCRRPACGCSTAPAASSSATRQCPAGIGAQAPRYSPAATRRSSTHAIETRHRRRWRTAASSAGASSGAARTVARHSPSAACVAKLTSMPCVAASRCAREVRVEVLAFPVIGLGQRRGPRCAARWPASSARPPPRPPAAASMIQNTGLRAAGYHACLMHHLAGARKRALVVAWMRGIVERAHRELDGLRRPADRRPRAARAAAANTRRRSPRGIRGPPAAA